MSHFVHGWHILGAHIFSCPCRGVRRWMLIQKQMEKTKRKSLGVYFPSVDVERAGSFRTLCLPCVRGEGVLGERGIVSLVPVLGRCWSWRPHKSDASCSKSATFCFNFLVSCPTAGHKNPSWAAVGCLWSSPCFCADAKPQGQGQMWRKASAGADPSWSNPRQKSEAVPLQPGESLGRHSSVKELGINPLWLFMFRLRESFI